jgi:hypothetical protein
VRRLRAAELVLPLLAPVAAVMSYWLGRECFHAGAFVARGSAWGIIGERGSGKSTTVAELALAGVPVVGDDLLVVRDWTVYAGTRAVDLRRDAAARLGVGESLGVVGARGRWRLALTATKAELALAGWIFLAWGDQVEATPLPGAERLVRLHAGRGINLPPRDPARLLELASLPGWELRRPKALRSADDAPHRLLDTVARGCGGGLERRRQRIRAAARVPRAGPRGALLGARAAATAAGRRRHRGGARGGRSSRGRAARRASGTPRARTRTPCSSVARHFSALPTPVALTRVPRTVAVEIRPGRDERWAQKLARVRRAFRNLLRPRSAHDSELANGTRD